MIIGKYKRTEECRRKSSESHKGKKHSEATKKKMSEQRIGKPKSESFKLKMSERMRGENNPSKRPEVRAKMSMALMGRKISKETRQKMSEIRQGMVGEKNPLWRGGYSKCIDCNIIRDKNYIRGRCRKCYSKYFTGENHPLWKGTQLLNKYLRKSLIYRQWRTFIFNRDDFTCQICYKRGTELQVDHHPKPFSKLLKTYNITCCKEAFNCVELWQTDNGRTLCKPCHLETPTWGYQKYINN